MSWSEFFSMGGYGLYVWGSYLAALLVMGGEVALLMRRRKTCKRVDRERNRASIASATDRSTNYETSS